MGATIAAHEGEESSGVTPTAAVASVTGIDVSSYQGNVIWQAQYNAGKRFAYVKATEGTTYRNPYFAHQYNGFSMTGRFPVIYTSTSWWNQCVGSGHGFGATVPLWWLDLPPRSAPCPVVGPITRSAVQLDADRPEPLQRCL